MSKYKLICIMGKSGSGKDTIFQSLKKKYADKFNFLVGYTSRPIRSEEQQGVSYNFVSEKEFKQQIEDNKMLEWQVFNGWYYGKSKDSLLEDKVNIGIFTPSGIRELLTREDISVHVFYVRARDKTRLLRALNRETNPNVKEIVRRFTTDEEDFLNIDDISYSSVYNEREESIDAITDIIYESTDRDYWAWN